MPPLSDQVAGSAQRLGCDVDVDLDAGSETIAGRRGGDELLLPAAERRARCAQPADNTAQRDLPGSREIVAPDNRREPIGRQLLTGQRQSNEGDAGAPPSERLPRHG